MPIYSGVLPLVHDFFRFHPVMERDVCGVIHEIKTVSFHADVITEDVVKLCSPTIIRFITHIMLVFHLENFPMHENKL